MKPTRLAVIGFGRWGHFCHAALIRLAPGLELAGIASSDAGKRAQIEAELGVRAYDSLEAVILDDSVDALVLATPNDTHFDFAMRALDAGKHVVTDKPMCLSLGECDAMIERAQARGLLLTTFQNRRLNGDFLTLQHLIAGGELGELRWLELSWGGFGQWGGWRATIEHGGGKFLDLGAHLIDQALLLFPCPVTGVYLRLHHDHPDSPVESEAFLVLEFENGATTVCDTSSLSTISKPRFYARGTQATFSRPARKRADEGRLEPGRGRPGDLWHAQGRQGRTPSPDDARQMARLLRKLRPRRPRKRRTFGAATANAPRDGRF